MMAEKTVASLDLDNLGTVKLDSGSEVPIPRLTNRRVIQLAKLIADVGGDILEDLGDFSEMSEAAIVSTALSLLTEEQIAKFLHIALGIDEGKALDFEFVDTMQILEAFAEKSNIKKALTAVQNMAKIFHKQNQRKAKKAEK